MPEGYAVYDIIIIMLIVSKTPAICQAVYRHCYITLYNKIYLNFNLNMFYYVNKCNWIGQQALPI